MRSMKYPENPKKIQVIIYPNQLAWMDKISTVLNQPKRQTFLECFAVYIGEFKKNMLREDRKTNE